MELNTPSLAFRRRKKWVRLVNPVFITIEGLPRNFPLSEYLSSHFLSVFLCPAVSLPSSVSPLFLRCNRPFVLQLPVVVGVSAVQSRVEQKVTRVQLSFVQDSSNRDHGEAAGESMCDFIRN